MAIAYEEVDDGDEDYGSNGGCGQAIDEAAAEDTQLGEDPAAEDGADEAEDDVGDAAVALATRDFAGEPAGEQADDDPEEQAVLPFDDYSAALKKNKREGG